MCLSIVLINCNGGPFLENCLRSIYSDASDQKTPFEVIVVDNNSGDKSINMVRESFPDVRLIKNTSNQGFAKANNRGIAASTGKYVLCLNNDTVVLPGALRTLTEFMDHDPDAGACGPMLLNRDRTVQHQCKRGFPTIPSAVSYFFGLHRLFPKSELFGHYLMTYIDPGQISEVDSVSGACLMVRRQVIEQVGLMDEDYNMYGEDIDWCYRIKQAGWRVYYVPEAKVLHYGGQTSSKIMPYRNTWEFHRSMVVFYKKHYSTNHNLLVNCLVYAGIWLKGVIALTVNLFRKEKIIGSRKP
jgi:GT2 family glycosyltransferase